jgi:hypothetical protein
MHSRSWLEFWHETAAVQTLDERLATYGRADETAAREAVVWAREALTAPG